MISSKTGEGGDLLAGALEHFRAGDVVATYAPDEVELLLPDTPGERASAVVDRVMRMAGIEGTIVGLAVAPDEADHPERLMRAARNALRTKLLESGRPSRLPSDPGRPSPSPIPRRGAPPPLLASDEEPVLEDAATRAAAEDLDARAAEPAPITIIGEPSSGKIAFAKRMHKRAGGGPLVVIACGKLAESAQLERALDQAADARGGTLVLDEISELTADGQARWLAALRALIGRTRLVVTTHRDLFALADRGAFSNELAELLFESPPVVVPPLRHRPDDIVPLATRFAEDSGARTPAQFSPGALARLRSYPWPGNVLELRNALERAVRLAGGGEILAEHLPGDTLASPAGDGRLREHVDSVERDAIVKALAETSHNQTHAAKRLGLSRRALIYKMEKYGLKAPPTGGKRR
jgi:DNA-binding NtrC family response regulator